MKNVICPAILGLAVLMTGCAASGSRPVAQLDQGCSSLGDPTRAAAPFFDGQVYAARPLSRTVSRTKAFQNRELVGAELDMRATPGMTPELLQRALSCHAASAKAAHPNDPLHPRGRVDEVGVRSTSSGFTISIVSEDSATARDILQRSEVFAGEGARVEVRQVARN